MDGDKIEGIGARIREALDESGDAAHELRVARQLLLDRVAERNVARFRPGAWGRITARTRRVLMVTGTVAFASLTLAVWLALPVTFRVGSLDAPRGRLGDRVDAGGGQAVSVWFSEGSSMIVDPGATVRVLSAEPTGARVLVERGAVDVAIVHRAARGTRWRFEAGPFHVLVTGTKFRVAWKPEDQSFSLETREGAVVVSSACLPAARTVRGGEGVRLSCAPPAVSTAARVGPPVGAARASASASAAAAADEEAAALALLDEPRRVAAPAERPPVNNATALTARAADWRELVASGRYSDGLRVAERVGFSQACRTANEQELLSLADAARLFGRTARAVEALGILRQRFPRSPGAATAAFSLGRIAFERQEAYGDAARWFATYLDEMPNGALTGDAAGRLMEARQRAGERTRARADAESYLGRFPGGPYAPAARAILSQ